MPAERQDHPARTAAGRSSRALPKMVGGKVIDGDGDMRVLDGTKMERAATPAELKLSRKLRALAKGGGGKRRTRGPVTRRTRDRDALKAQALTNARKKVRRRPTTEAPSKAHMQKKGRAAWGRVDRVDMIDVPEGEDEMVGAEVDGLKIRLPRNGGRPYVDTENGPVPLDGVFVSRPEVDALLKGSKDTFDADKLTPEQHDAVQSAWGKVDRLHGGQTVSGEDRSVSVADITDSHGEKIVFTVPDRGGEVTVDYRRDRSEMTDDEIARGDDPWLTDQPTGIFLDEAEVDAKRQGKAAPELDAKRRRQVRQRTEAPVKPEGDDFDRANPNSDLSEKLIEDGGFTIDPADGSGPTVGYVVARPGHSKIMTREEFEAGGEHDINEYLRKLRDEEANPDVMLGGWYDARHDEIVLDRVEVVDSEDEAVRLGQERNEQAIWDLKGQREIPTGGTGTGADRKPVTPVSADSTDADVDRSFAEAVDAAVPEARRKRVADGGGPRGDTVKDAVAEDVVDMARESGMTDDQIRGALDRNGGPDGVDRASFDKALDRPRPDDMSGTSSSEGDVTAGRALALQRVKDAASTTPATSQPKPGSPDIPADVAGLPGVDSGSGTKEDPLRVSDMSTAVKLLGDGKYHIQLNRPDEVATLLDKVREETAKFKERGEKEPVFNLCLVSVPGSNLFCVDDQTEMMTSRGWRRYDELSVGDTVLTLNHDTGLAEWQPLEAVNVFPSEDRLVLSMEGQFHSSLTSSEHRWPVVQTKTGARLWKVSETLLTTDRIQTVAPVANLPTEPKYEDAFVELVAWVWTEGTFDGAMTRIYQSHRYNPGYVADIARTLTSLFGDERAELQSIRTALKGGRTGAVRAPTPGWRRSENDSTGMTSFFLNGAASTALRTVMDGDKVVDPSFIASLTLSQLHLFIDRSVDADGHRGRVEGFSQRSVERVRIFEMACALAGVRTNTTERPETRPGRKSGLVQYQVGVLRRSSPYTSPMSTKNRPECRTRVEWVHHKGILWCPTTPNGTWLARRRGTVWYTGNCADSVGYDRIRMPQLSTANPVPGSYADSLPRNGKGEVDLTEDFLKWLEEVKGIKVKRGTKVYASHLRASQAELRGGKVTGMMEGMKAGKVPPGVISQTSDGYIIDGHHRWAANTGLSMGGSNPVMETNTIDADIVTILALANQFASDMGSPPMAASVSGRTTKPVLFFAGVDRPEQSKAFTEVGWLTPDGFAPTPVWGDLPGTDPATVYVGDAPWAGMDPDGLYDSAVVMASPVFTTDAPDVADPPELVDPPDSAFG